jgi:predicted secreted hydrolase
LVSASTPGASTPGALRAARIACFAALGYALSSAGAPTPGASPEPPAYAPVLPGHSLEFPADYGSHPDFRTEWWYVTGWLETRGGEPLGFQITFFRTRPAINEANPSAFTPRQLLIAHCALSDPKRGRLWQDQSIRRAGLGLAQAAVGDTDVVLDRWTLKRLGEAYLATIDADDFALHLKLTATQAPLRNGDSGVSRKGPAPQAASYYYSVPHLRVAGSIEREGRTDAVTGEAWFDHEWSSEYLEAGAVGWDWIGINLADGAALMAFRIRGSSGEPRWAGATLRASDGTTEILGPADVQFAPLRSWTSPRTGIRYPLEWRIRVGAREFELAPLMDDQENDTRLSTGAIYWEGAVRAYEAHRQVGRGYLELTGYGEPLHLR